MHAKRAVTALALVLPAVWSLGAAAQYSNALTSRASLENSGHAGSPAETEDSSRTEVYVFLVPGQADFLAEPEDPAEVEIIAEPEDPGLVCFVQTTNGAVGVCDPYEDLVPAPLTWFESVP